MGIADITDWSLGVMLVALRITPTLAFSPPFTLIKVPSVVRATVILSLAFAIASGLPTRPQPFGDAVYGAAIGELAYGLTMALGLQFAFAMIGVAGRMLDIQAGFGLAFLIDPTTRAQMPLFAAVLGYAAGIIFLWSGGLPDMLGVLQASFAKYPLGAATGPSAIGPMVDYLSVITSLSLGVTALATIVLFLVDISIALLSRTLPQMNMLVLGFQIKSFATLLILPIMLGAGAAAIARILRIATEAMLRIA